MDASRAQLASAESIARRDASNWGEGQAGWPTRSRHFQMDASRAELDRAGPIGDRDAANWLQRASELLGVTSRQSRRRDCRRGV
jgi:hypothetical protein